MENSSDVKIEFLTRGDDIEMLNQAIALVPHDNEALAGYLCYLKAEMLDQLKDNFPKVNLTMLV